jgi:hypothetical protein
VLFAQVDLVAESTWNATVSAASAEPWQWTAESEGPQGLIMDQRGYFHKNKLASAPWRWAAGIIDWVLLIAIPWPELYRFSDHL